MAFSHVSNVLGYINPAKEICSLARQAGARVIIDGAQAAPHVRIDVQDLGCDFYVFSGHKMLGPMATGVVWGRAELLDAMPPYHVGSNMAHEVDFERAAFEHGAQKFQAGTPDVAGPVGLAAAVKFIDDHGRDALWAHDQDLVRHGLARLGCDSWAPLDWPEKRYRPSASLHVHHDRTGAGGTREGSRPAGNRDQSRGYGGTATPETVWGHGGGSGLGIRVLNPG